MQWGGACRHVHPRTPAEWGPEGLRRPRLCLPSSLRSVHRPRLTTLSAFSTPHPSRQLAKVPQTQTRRDHTPGLLHWPLFAFTASARVLAEATRDGEGVASLEVAGATRWPRCLQLSPSSRLQRGPFSQTWELGQQGQKGQVEGPAPPPFFPCSEEVKNCAQRLNTLEAACRFRHFRLQCPWPFSLSLVSPGNPKELCVSSPDSAWAPPYWCPHFSVAPLES